MIEKFPTNNESGGEVSPNEEVVPTTTDLEKVEQEVTLSPEEERGIYNQIVELFRVAKGKKIRNPYDRENPIMTSVWDAFDEWKRLRGLDTAGIENEEKARDAVRASMVLVEAGFVGKKDLKLALEDITNELNIVLKQSGGYSETVVDILEKGRGSLREMLNMKPEQIMLNQELALVKEKEESGDLSDALRLMSSILFGGLYNGYFKDRLDEKNDLIKERDRLRDKFKGK